MVSDGLQNIKISEHIEQPKKGLAIRLFVSHNNFH